jgi:hypothetical protein
MLHAAEVVGHVPVVGFALLDTVVHRCTSCDTLGRCLAPRWLRSPHPRRPRRPSQTSRPTSATDLMPEHTTDYAADDRAPERWACPGVATCWRSTQQRCSGGPTTARTESRPPRRCARPDASGIVSRRSQRWRHFGELAARPAHGAHRRNEVVHTQRSERVVASGAQHDAVPLEVGMFANFPAPPLHDNR